LPAFLLIPMRRAHHQPTISSSQGCGLYEFTHELRDWVNSMGIPLHLIGE